MASWRLRQLARQVRSGLAAVQAGLAQLTFDQGLRRRRAFQDVYRRGLWGHEEGTAFFSGVGSRGEAADAYVARMAALLAGHAAELGRPLTVIDLGCGDFQIGRRLMDAAPDITYVGCDIVPELIAKHRAENTDPRASFAVVDIVADTLPPGDVCLVRQVLQHNSNAAIAATLAKLTYPFVYVTEGRPENPTGPVNPDKPPGFDVRFDWRTGKGRGVELDQPPFNLRTERVMEAHTPPYELVVTERVFNVSA